MLLRAHPFISWLLQGPADPLTYNRHVCGKLFNFSSPKASGFVVPVRFVFGASACSMQ